MTKTLSLKALIVAGLVLAVALALVPAVLAGGPHNKATGSVTWAARGGQLPGLMSYFDVHDNAPGMDGDRGYFYLYRPADSTGFTGGWLAMDVSCVNVESSETYGDPSQWGNNWKIEKYRETNEFLSRQFYDGGYADRVGGHYLYWVQDNATPGSAGDMIGGSGKSYADIGSACEDVNYSHWRGSGQVTDGNLNVFYY